MVTVTLIRRRRFLLNAVIFAAVVILMPSKVVESLHNGKEFCRHLSGSSIECP